MAASTTSGKWSAQPCHQSRPYVCKVPATEDTCPTQSPRACTDNSKATAICVCGTDTCDEGQYCHKYATTKCVDRCAVVGVSVSVCQCVPATGGGVGSMCSVGQICLSDGTCVTPAPPVCPFGSPATSICTCNDNECVKGQICDDTGTGVCSPPFCLATGGAPYSGCICGSNGVKCGQDYTCNAATGTCTAPALPACTDNAREVNVCTCGRNVCAKNQYCHAKNSLCLDVCIFGSVVSGTTCQCVPVTGGGDGSICMPGGTCYDDGVCSTSG